MRKKFRLPMTLSTLVVQRGSDQFLAHSLDFDLVETGSTEQEAWDNLTLAITSYVEFGLRKGWDDFILCESPDSVTEKFTSDADVKFMPPIQIANVKRSVVVVRTHESLQAA